MSITPARTSAFHRPTRRVVVGGFVAAVVSSAMTVVATSAPASAAAAVGTFTIGTTPTPLNQPSDPTIGVLTPTADAAQNGMFGAQTAWPIIPIHAALARNGHLITFGTPLDSAAQGGLTYDDWDITAGLGRGAHVDTASMHDYNSFCNSLAELPDGRFVMVGGNSTMSTMIYDPVTRTQDMGQNLTYQRWYSTTLRLTDGRMLVLGGGNYYNTTAYQKPDDSSGVATTPEVGTGTGAWTKLTGAASTAAFGATDNRWWYPRAFNGPTGGVVGTSGDQIWSLSTTGAGSLAILGKLPFNPKVSGSQVMFAPGKVLVAGGGQPFNEDASQATNQAAIIDFSTGTAKTASTSSMAFARNWLNLTVLPTGEVFANGGTRVGTQGGDANSVKQAEIWSPQTGAWRPVATAARTRTYHSTTLLLPSGALFTGGGGAPGPEDNLNAELYYPPYLFTKGADGVVRWASRPAITTIAGSATHGGKVDLGIGDGRQISAVSLISMPSVTHSENTDQRRIPLTFTQQNGVVSAALPASVNTMPAGDYELTVVDTKGVPSAAQIVTIRNGAAGLVTVASANQVTGSGKAAGDSDGSVPLTVDTSVGLEAVNYLGSRLQHQNFLTYLRPVGDGSSAVDKNGTSWLVRTGLADAAGVSFESIDWPGWYLTAPANGAGAVGLVQNDGTTAFAGRATFNPVVGNTGQNTSLQVWRDKSLYLRHQNYQFFAQPLAATDLGRADTTFAVRAGLAKATPVPLAAGRAVGFEAVNFPGYRLQHQNFAAYLKAVGTASSAADRNGTTWIVRTGLASANGVTFESVDWPGWFLAAPANGAGAMGLVKNDGSTAFAGRATFAAVAGANGTNTSLQVWRDRSLSVRHQNYQFFAQAAENTDLFRADSTLVIRTALSPAPTR